MRLRRHSDAPSVSPQPRRRAAIRARTSARIGALAGLTLAALAVSPAALGATAKAASAPFGNRYEHLSYGASRREQLDVYASATPHAPIVVLVHGGGWRIYAPLDAYNRESIALQQQGFTVFTINYDQDSPTRPAFPLETNDVADAVHWAIANAATFNGNPADVVLLGGSAGGQLVSIAAEQLDAANPGTVRGVVSLSGPMNFKTLVSMAQNETLTEERFVTALYQALGIDGGGPFARTNGTESYEATWSPALNVATAHCPNWALFSSEQDLIPLSQSQEMQTALAGAGCKASLTVVPGEGHAFSYWNQVGPAVISFIRSQ